MADDKYYCGCGHSAWGMLLLFSVIQVFLSSSLFPGVVEIFDGSIAVRSARTNIESAASAMDGSRTYTSNTTTSTTVFTADPASTGTSASSIWEYPPSNYGVLQLNYQDAYIRLQAVYNRYFSFNKVPAISDVTFQFVASKVDPNTGDTLANDVWMIPSTSFYFANDNGNRVTGSASASKLGTFDLSVGGYNVSGLSIATTFEKKVSTILTNSLIRTEALGGFFFLQWIVGLVLFGLALKHYHAQTPPSVLPILSTVGLVLMFLGWVVGWFYNSPWALDSLFDTFLTDNAGSFADYVASPFVGLLIFNWVMLLIYSNYTLAFVNNGGRDEPETPAYQEHNMSNSFGNTIKGVTTRFSRKSTNSPNATGTANAGETKVGADNETQAL